MQQDFNPSRCSVLLMVLFMTGPNCPKPNVIDCVDRIVLGNELRLGVLLNGKRTGLWEPELLLVGRGSNTYFMQKYDNKFRKFI